MSLKIILDNYNNKCFAGETISGRIECTFNSSKKLQAIIVNFRGRCKTSWTDRESEYNLVTKKDEYVDVEYNAEENYINVKYNLIQGSENITLPPGKHVYPFSYILPKNIPSSFEDKVGNIRYYIKAVVERPWKFNYETRVPLNVVSPIDLNDIRGLRDPVALSIDKTPCSCWCNDPGAITFNISVPVTGYVPGQEINIGSYVQNLSNESAERVQYKVAVAYEYIAHHPSKNSKWYYYDAVRCVEGGIGAHGEKSWTSTLRIPVNGIYPNLRSCSIINVQYLLKAKIFLPSPYKNMKLDFPITIGSVALSGVDTTLSGPPAVESPPYLPSTSKSDQISQHAGALAPYLANVDELPSYLPLEASSSYPEKKAG